MALPYQTLHSHTTASDGEHTHKEVLDICRQNKIGVVAFTDHDTVPSREELSDLAQLKEHEVKYIIGTEFSSGYPQEVGGVGELFHIVGLFIDPTNSRLLDYTRVVEESRARRVRETTKNLEELGFSITFDDVLKEGAPRSLGRPHVVKALLKKPENLKRLKEIEARFWQDREAPEFQRLAKRLKEADDWQKVFTLVLTEGSYINDVYVPYKNVLDFDGVVELIHAAGGVALLAHWTFSKRNFGEKNLEKLCKEKRVDGLETIYGFGEPPNLKKEIMSDIEFLEGLVKKFDLAYGGGGDFHTKEDFSLMLQEKELAERTKDLVDNILRIKKPDLTWSSLK